MPQVETNKILICVERDQNIVSNEHVHFSKMKIHNPIFKSMTMQVIQRHKHSKNTKYRSVGTENIETLRYKATLHYDQIERSI